MEEKISKRHHYIPQFLISGFTENNKVFLYDKLKNKILDKSFSPKSIFFENHRNTIKINSIIQSSIIEDKLYSEIDTKCSRVIRKYQESNLNDLKFTNEEIALILFFQVSLFWRIPRTDETYEDIINRTDFKINGVMNENIKSNPEIRKLTRSSLFLHHLSEMKNNGKVKNKFNNIHEFQNQLLIIGDYPFIIRNDMTSFSEFNDSDILFAISSTRIHSSTTKLNLQLSDCSALHYNALIILHSVRYVAASNRELLQQSIDLFRTMTPHNISEFYKIAFSEN